MEVIILNKRKFASLQKYKLDKTISNSEGDLYIFNATKTKELLKIYDLDEGLYLGNKLLTINTLIDNKSKINMKELIMPKKLVIVENHVVGFSMDFIENVNLKTVFVNDNIPISQKIEYLKEIGGILERVQKVVIENHGFHLGDIHESNFIIETKTGKIRVADLDSCKIANNQPSVIKYLGLNEDIAKMPYKYHQAGDLYIADSNTDVLCYDFMILNTLSKGKVNMYNAVKYYSYLDYLRSLGFGYGLLDCLCNIYTAHNNEFPTKFLDQIPGDVTMAHHREFEKVISKR